MATISGGMEFPQGQPIRLAPVPEQLPAGPLHIRCPGRPEVIPGQVVRRGQFLIEPLRTSDPCYVSPATATVRQVTPDERGGYALVLDPPGETVVTSLEVSPPRGRKLSGWFTALRQVGPWPEVDGGVGLISQLEAAQRHPIDTLVCVGLDPFPPCADQSSLLLSFPDDAVLGTLILADLVEAKNVVMLAGRVPALLGKLRSSCRKYRLRLTVVHNRYPSAHPTMVAQAMGVGPPQSAALPQGHNPVERGLMMIQPWTAIRVGRWFTLRRFDLVRPLFVAEPHAEEHLSSYYAMPGQPLAGVDPVLFSEEQQERVSVIAGDPMTGHRLTVPATVPEDHTLLTVIPEGRAPWPEPCINCGWCLDVCPTRLDPVRMLHAAVHRTEDAWLSDQLPWCIECGLCSYVCPSALHLAQTFKAVHREMEQPA